MAASGAVDTNLNFIGPTVDWKAAADIFTGLEADVLFIMDCCYASSIAVQNADGPEVLAASTWHTTAGSEHTTCFTQNLINELKALSGNPASVASIYAQIHRSTKPAKDTAACPFHVAKVGRGSIVLTKLQPVPMLTQLRMGPLKEKDERVVVTVHLSDHHGFSPDVEQWKSWLTSNIPSHISKTQITFEGLFETDSILVLISMPLEIWTMLPNEDDTYGFLGFVKSGNLLLPRQTALPLHNMKGNERPTLVSKDPRN